MLLTLRAAGTSNIRKITEFVLFAPWVDPVCRHQERAEIFRLSDHYCVDHEPGTLLSHRCAELTSNRKRMKPSRSYSVT
jgi:hypothetical protein